MFLISSPINPTPNLRNLIHILLLQIRHLTHPHEIPDPIWVRTGSDSGDAHGACPEEEDGCFVYGGGGGGGETVGDAGEDGFEGAAGGGGVTEDGGQRAVGFG